EEDSPVRWSAADALGSIGKESEDVINLLINILKDKEEDSYVRWSAAAAVWNLTA
ncbi:MAG: HEAT repeat domain-containing protein, partial [bacterium]